MTTERLALIITSGALIAIGTLRYCGVTGNLTTSEPVGLYIRTLTAPARGGMVELRPLIKHIAGIPGDTIRVAPEGSFINGKLWPAGTASRRCNGS